MSKTKYTIEDMQKLARERGGKCLFEEYVNSKTKLLWECSEGHQWEASPDNIIRDKWCPKCADLKTGNRCRSNTKEFIKKSNKIHNNKYDYNLVEYKTAIIPVKIKCKIHGIFKQTPNNHLRGQGCPKCGKLKQIKSQSLTIQEIKSEGFKKGLLLLSTKYNNSKTKLKWKCEKCDYEFEKTYENLKVTKGCPKCSQGISELICRIHFEQIFNNKFIKVRPKWLFNSKGNKMELDGYCKILGIAFEHQGIQHYEYNDFFHKNERDLGQRKKDDKLKKELCEKNNVKLIIIPSLNFKLNKNNLKQYIINECIKQNIELPNNINDIKIDLSRIYNLTKTQQFIEKARNIHGNKYDYSEVFYSDCFTKIKIFHKKCKKYFYQSPSKHLSKQGCPYCAPRIVGKKNSIILKNKNFKGKDNPSAKHFIFYSPCDIRHDVIGNIVGFCKEQRLNRKILYKILNGERENNYKGWSVYRVEDKPKEKY